MGLLQRSITAGILIVYILMLRRFAFRRLSKRVFAILWKVAVVRLLLPFSFQVESAFFNALFGKNGSLIMLEGQGGGRNMAAGAEVPRISSFFFQNAVIVYFLGAALLALFFALGYARLCFLLREAIPVGVFGDTGMDVEKNCKGLTGKVRIVVMDRIKTPMTYGILRPRIVLPKSMDWKNEDMLFAVFRHELTHIKSMDNLWKLLAIAALCLHWFNPLVLVLYFLLNKDIELACDESVISAMNENERQKYAMTLVVLAENCALSDALCSGFGKSAVSERIREIMNYKKMTKIGSFCAALVLLGSTIVFVSAKEIEAESAPHNSITVMEESMGDHEDEDCATVYFDAGITEERKEEIGNELLAIDGVTGVGYTSADEAWEVFVKEYLSEDIVLCFGGENPLKDSANYTVYFSDIDEAAIRAIEGMEGVRRVVRE